MKIKTKDLIDTALDWAVAECEIVEPGRASGIPFLTEHRIYLEDFVPSCAWSQGGPIIERESISVIRDWDRMFDPGEKVEPWCATKPMTFPDMEWCDYGHTPLIAAMRCYVASKLGDEVDVPDELMKT